MTNWSIALDLCRSGFSYTTDFKARTELLIVTGPSGSGKTTLVDTLIGSPSTNSCKGRIVVNTQIILSTDQSISLTPQQRPFAWAPQGALLFPHLSILENLRLSGAGEKNIEDTIADLDLTAFLSRSTSALSGGERQRVAYARATLTQKPILVLDESFSSIDQERKEGLLRHLVELVQQGTKESIVYVSHSEAEIEYLANQLNSVRIDF